MILVIGGQHQGKREFAMRQFALAEDAVMSGADVVLQPGAELDLSGVQAIYGLQTILEQAALWPAQERENLLAQLKALPADFVVICDEVGLGLVPIERAGREYRELVGRTCCDLAAAADEVWRVFCGLPQRLK